MIKGVYCLYVRVLSWFVVHLLYVHPRLYKNKSWYISVPHRKRGILVVSHRSNNFMRIPLKVGPQKPVYKYGCNSSYRGWNNPSETHFFSAIYRGYV